MPLILGLESSCDETGAAIVEDATLVRSSDGDMLAVAIGKVGNVDGRRGGHAF